MLDYLDDLCGALLARNGTEIRRLLRHPLARALPRRVREESYAIARADPGSVRAPVHALHFYHQTVKLLGGRAASEALRPASSTDMAVFFTPADDDQPEIPLRALGS